MRTRNDRGLTMNHAPAQYINAGFSYELGKTPAQTLRTMLEAESIEDRPEARKLIETLKGI